MNPGGMKGREEVEVKARGEEGRDRGSRRGHQLI